MLNKFLLFFIISITACINLPLENKLGQKTTNKATLYSIAKGKHRSNKFSWRPQQASRIDFQFHFDSTAIYSTRNPENQGDINKLYGMSDHDFHHRNSARFGWRWYNEQLEIWAYCYNNGKRSYQLINTVSIDYVNKASIIFDQDKYVFKLNETTVEMPRLVKEPFASGYKLFPYFGGDEEAPHEVRIWIKEMESS